MDRDWGRHTCLYVSTHGELYYAALHLNASHLFYRQQLPLLFPLVSLGSSSAEAEEMPYVSAKESQILLESMYRVNCSRRKVWFCLVSVGTGRSFIKKAWGWVSSQLHLILC